MNKTVAVQIGIIALFASTKYAEMKTSASSILGNDPRYSHSNVLDGNIETAWVEGDAGDGINEWILIDFDKIVQLDYLGIIPGYAKNKGIGNDRWTQNNRVKTLFIEFSDKKRKKVTLSDIESMQYIIVDKKTSFVLLTIKDVYRGSLYNDACISEIKPIINNKLPGSNFIKKSAYNVRPDDEKLFLSFGPISLDFTKNPSASSVYFDSTSTKSSMLFTTSYYDFDFTPGTSFHVETDNVKLLELQIRHEYRSESFMGDGEGYMFHIPFVDDTSYSAFTTWHKIPPIKNQYVITDSMLNDTAIVSGSVKMTNEVLENYLDKRGFDESYKKMIQTRPTGVKRFSTRLRIDYLKGGNQRQLSIVVRQSILP